MHDYKFLVIVVFLLKILKSMVYYNILQETSGEDYQYVEKSA